MSSPKIITLTSSDGETFDLEEAVALQSQIIKAYIEENCTETSFLVPVVTGKILAKVVEYCKHQVDAPKCEEEASKSFSSEFLDVDEGTLLDLTLAANYLNIESLLDLTCQTMADIIKEKTPEAVRQIFNIENDFTQEEEVEVRRQYAWAYE